MSFALRARPITGRSGSSADGLKDVTRVSFLLPKTLLEVILRISSMLFIHTLNVATLTNRWGRIGPAISSRLASISAAISDSLGIAIDSSSMAPVIRTKRKSNRQGAPGLDGKWDASNSSTPGQVARLILAPRETLEHEAIIEGTVCR